jgi:aminoglycoside phosphotransferase (APT) family kinase protein
VTAGGARGAITFTAADAKAFAYAPRHSLDEVERVLAGWLREQTGAADVTVSNLTHPVGSGGSNETVLLDAEWDGERRELVLRLDAGDYCLYPETDLGLQCEVLRVLHANRYVAVPEVLWFEPDAGPLGRPFALMERVAGRVPRSVPIFNLTGWLADASPAERELLWTNAVRELARVHRVPLEDVAFVRPGGFDELLDYWVHGFERARGGRALPAFQRVLDWLLDNVPAERPVGFSWGDSRIGNMMFADDFSVAAVLDWEQLSLGGPLQDLGWWLLFDVVHSSAIGVERLPGLGTRDETIALWRELTGGSVDDLHWYEAFAGFKVSYTFLRKVDLDGTGVPGQDGNDNVFTRLTSSLLELPPPEPEC